MSDFDTQTEVISRQDDFALHYQPIDNRYFIFSDDHDYASHYDSLRPVYGRARRANSRAYSGNEWRERAQDLVFITPSQSQISALRSVGSYATAAPLNYMKNESTKTGILTFSTFNEELINTFTVLDFTDHPDFLFCPSPLHAGMSPRRDLIWHTANFASNSCSFLTIFPKTDFVHQAFSSKIEEHGKINSYYIKNMCRGPYLPFEQKAHTFDAVYNKPVVFAFKIRVAGWHHSFPTYDTQDMDIICLGVIHDAQYIVRWKKATDIFNRLAQVAEMTQDTNFAFNPDLHRSELASKYPSFSRYWPGITPYCNENTEAIEFDYFSDNRQDVPNSIFTAGQENALIENTPEFKKYERLFESLQQAKAEVEAIERQIEARKQRIDSYKESIATYEEAIRERQTYIEGYERNIEANHRDIASYLDKLHPLQDDFERIDALYHAAKDDLEEARAEIISNNNLDQVDWYNNFFQSGFCIQQISLCPADQEEYDENSLIDALKHPHQLASDEWRIYEMIYSTNKPSVIAVYRHGDFIKNVVAGPFAFRILCEYSDSARHTMSIKAANSSSIVGINENHGGTIECCVHPHASQYSSYSGSVSPAQVLDSWRWICEGELLPAMTQALSAKNIGHILQATMAWMLTCNADDTYGRRFDWFPSPEEVNINAEITPPIADDSSSTELDDVRWYMSANAHEALQNLRSQINEATQLLENSELTDEEDLSEEATIPFEEAATPTPVGSGGYVTYFNFEGHE